MNSYACYSIVFILIFVPCIASADTVIAPSCSQDDVRDAIMAAEDGDTVLVPVGQSVWSYCMEIDPMPAILLLGAGAGRTTIVNEVPRTGWEDCPFWITSEENRPFRISGFTFQGGQEGLGNSYQGTIRIAGTCKGWRIDHCRFQDLRARAVVTTGYTFGVIDHCVFMAQFAPNILVSHSDWGGHSYGDGSWADALSLGTHKAIYVENNDFTWQTTGFVYSCIDSHSGGRYVFRHNNVTNSYVINHGTETNGRMRSCFSYEIYNNTFSRLISPTWWTLFHCRGGTGVMFGNEAEGNYTSLCHAGNYRDYHAYAPWGKCDGESPYDNTDGIIHDSGNHTGGNEETVLACANKHWVIDAWAGYALLNTTQGTSSTISSNTENTITYLLDPEGAMQWDWSDAFEIRYAYPSLDQVGRSTGNLLHNWDPPLPEEWPQQIQEPFYEWDNTINGVDADIVSDSPHIVEGRDFFNSLVRPDYTPYTYPHPSTRSGKTLIAEAHEIPASSGASIRFVLFTGEENVGRKYLLLGSASGTTPGHPLPGGHATLPLNWDPLTDLVLTLLNTPVFSAFYGELDGLGRADAVLNAPPLPSAWIGTTLHFAFCLNNPFDHASNELAISISP